MPELPEVETIRQGLVRHVIGKTIDQVVLRRMAIRFPIPPEIDIRSSGRTITRVDRNSKYLMLVLDDGGRILVHLGMTGKLFYLKQSAATYEPQKHDHVLFPFAKKGGLLVYNDARRFGVIDYIAPDTPSHRLLDVLGIDPLSDALSPAFLLQRFAGKSTSMKTILMDQSVIAGLGNIYVCEALFRSGICPERAARTLTKAESARLEYAIRSVLADALKAGGSSLRDYVDADGDQGLFQHSFSVYGREEQPCHVCGTPVRRIVQSGRSSFFCPTCQKPHKKSK